MARGSRYKEREREIEGQEREKRDKKRSEEKIGRNTIISTNNSEVISDLQTQRINMTVFRLNLLLLYFFGCSEKKNNNSIFKSVIVTQTVMVLYITLLFMLNRSRHLHSNLMIFKNYFIITAINPSFLFILHYCLKYIITEALNTLLEKVSFINAVYQLIHCLKQSSRFLIHTRQKNVEFSCLIIYFIPACRKRGFFIFHSNVTLFPGPDLRGREGKKRDLCPGRQILGGENFERNFFYKLKIKTFLLFHCFNLAYINKMS